MDADSIKRANVRRAMGPMLKGSGFTPEQFIEKYSDRVDVFLIDAEATGSFSDNINILPSSAQSLPELSEIKGGLKSVNAVAEEGSTVSTSLGEGLRQDYRISTGGQEIYGASLVLKNGQGGYSQVTVSAGDDHSRDAITQRLLKSWKKS